MEVVSQWVRGRWLERGVDLLLQQPTVLIRPDEKVISDLDSLSALIKAVTRQRLLRSKVPSPYSTRR